MDCTGVGEHAGDLGDETAHQLLAADVGAAHEARRASSAVGHLVLPFERLEYAYAELVKLAGAVEVIEPAELREQLAAAGQSLLATYGD